MANNNIVCATLLKKDDLQLTPPPSDFPLAVGKGQVKVQVKSVGICGSDVHYWTHGRIGDFVVNRPMVLGHESSGVVVEVGEGVNNVKIGDRVAMEPGVPCRSCSNCKTGRYNLCADVQFMATPPVHGSLANFVIHAADFCFKLPENLTFDHGALLEPLSVAIHACRRAHVTSGSRVLITGAGPIGLVNLMVAKCSGASQVAIVDLKASRLEVAKQLGADLLFQVEDPDLDHKISQFNPDISLECSGAASATKLCCTKTKSGGVVMIIGMSGSPEISIPLIQTSAREVDIRGVFRYANCYPTAIELLASGKIDASPLITHHFDLSQVVRAFEVAKDMTDGKKDAIKVMLHLNQD